MAGNKDDNQHDDDTPKAKLKTVLLASVLAFTLSITSSTIITHLLLSSNKTDPAVLEKNEDQDDELLKLRTIVEEQVSKIAAIEAQNETLKLYLRHSSATALKNILIDQEKNLQSYLKITRGAITDLSPIVPRSTDWSIKYQYQLDLAQKNSLERQDLLKLLKTGEPKL